MEASRKVNRPEKKKTITTLANKSSVGEQGGVFGEGAREQIAEKSWAGGKKAWLIQKEMSVLLL